MTSLRGEGLVRTYGGVVAIDGVTFDFPDGRFVCLLGPSGCGKTTLLRLIAGLEVPTAGRILFDGVDLSSVPAHDRGIGMVFQSLALFPHLTVAENVAYPLRIRRIARTTCKMRVDELLDLVKLHDVRDRRIHQLSGGQRQRVAIARALAIEPTLFLLDEPLSALDALLREHMQVELRLLQQRLGITTVVVTHDQREAMTMADLVVVMNRGCILQAAPPIEIYHNPANSFVASFIGAANLLECRRAKGETVEIFGRRVTIPEGRASGISVGKDGMLAVRPEDVSLKPTVGENDFEGVVEFIRDLGASVEISVAVHGQTILSVSTPKDRPPVETGQRVGISFNTSRVALMPQ
ncbi:MAG: ABC transporter ATP-binding protein [Rhodobacteraceae bacterium]|nr:ABC transporter ATP-binding protein [Paracoccaceae bacterium]